MTSKVKRKLTYLIQLTQTKKSQSLSDCGGSLTLRITDQNNDILTDGPEVTVVLHIR